MMKNTGYVYIRSEPGLYTVGFYDPAGKWQPESDCETRQDAADRVRYLNGGAVEGMKPAAAGAVEVKSPAAAGISKIRLVWKMDDQISQTATFDSEAEARDYLLRECEDCTQAHIDELFAAGKWEFLALALFVEKIPPAPRTLNDLKFGEWVNRKRLADGHIVCVRVYQAIDELSKILSATDYPSRTAIAVELSKGEPFRAGEYEYCLAGE